MTNLAYLLVAVGISLVGCLILWYRHRKPRSLEAGISEFSRELRALAPEKSGPGDRQEARPG